MLKFNLMGGLTFLLLMIVGLLFFASLIFSCIYLESKYGSVCVWTFLCSFFATLVFLVGAYLP
jgi:hypothetical protein